MVPLEVVRTKEQNESVSEMSVGKTWNKTPTHTLGAKNPDSSTGPLTRPFARSLAPLTHSLAPLAPSAALTRSLARSLHSLVPSLAHFTHSLARGKVIGWLFIVCFFFRF